LFACHYFLLTAGNEGIHNRPNGITLLHNQAESLQSEDKTARVTYAEYQKSHGYRRFGASLPIRGQYRGRDLIGDFGGMGLKTRLSSYDTYVPSSVPDQVFHKSLVLEIPCPRMCHTITDLGDAGALLVGGRNSPDNGLVDCWLHHKWTNTWERVDNLPTSRYRHSAVSIGAGSVLIAGGKSNSRSTLKDFSVWSRRHGWVECVINWVAENKDEQPAIFGGMLAVVEMDSSNTQTIIGILAGGMAQDGLISENIWIWTLHGCDGDVSVIRTLA